MGVKLHSKMGVDADNTIAIILMYVIIKFKFSQNYWLCHKRFNLDMQ